MGEKSILYAEDDENDAFFMKRAFKYLNRGEELHVVGDGDCVVNYLETIERSLAPEGELSVRLLLLDVKLPGRSGLEVLRWVRQRSRFSRLPVVMLSSSTQAKDIELAARHGANAYLVKPSNAENLSELIAKILSVCLAELPASGSFDIPGNALPVKPPG